MINFFQEFKFILVFFFVLTAATVSSYMDFNSEKLMARTPAEILQQVPSTKPLLSNQVNLRTPSSVDPSQLEYVSAEFFCKKNEAARFKKSLKSLVMMNFKICEELKSNRHIWIKNETNGFKAQVFMNGHKMFRTDFIQLNSGLNKLIIEAVLKDGQKRVQSLEIISGS